ncbi:MAG: toprim domain-containing protein [Rhodoferax sp.]|nr:toprim domain-containing protein [Rhodoferax sp.]
MTAGGILTAMAAAGLRPHKDLDIPSDGKIHRYRVQGDKSGSTNGWAVLHGGVPAVGAFGSWKTGESHNWHGGDHQALTPAERAAMEQGRQAMREAYARERAEVQAQAAKKACRLWDRAKPATNAHAYLQRKQVNAYGLKQLGEMLLVPARDVAGTIHTLQFILQDGSKRFLTGGRIAGCYYAIGKPLDRLLICEGMATAATVYQATGFATAAAFSAGNLEAVARALRGKFPDLPLVLIADNDLATAGNPGLTKAQQAARAVRGFLAVPRLREAAGC